jgi:hypothetical protein
MAELVYIKEGEKALWIGALNPGLYKEEKISFLVNARSCHHHRQAS